MRILYFLSFIYILLISLKLPAQTPVYSTPYKVTTLAGTAIQGTGFMDATGPNAYFNQPAGITVDKSGNIYIADSGNYAIRKITTTGIVTTLAGQSPPLATSGNVDGPALSAKFGVIKGITTDEAGNLYVTDTTYNTVRKISLVSGSWIVSTLVPLTAGLKNPISITYDTFSGNLFVSDAGNFVIRKITPTGTMSTFAGTLGVLGGIDGVPGTGTFGSPSGLVADGNGNLYCVDSPSSTLRKISSSGTISTIAGYIGAIGLLDGPQNNSTAQFSQPFGIAIDTKGNLYVTDQANLTLIRQITNSGTISTLAGALASAGRADGTGAQANFNQPHALTVDSSGTIYVADTGSSTIRKMVNATATVPAVPTLNSGTISGTLGSPLNYTLNATNSPATFAISSGSLPSGLNLTTTNGLISGIPSSAGTSQVYFTASNSAGISSPTLITFAINSAANIGAPLISVQPSTQSTNPGTAVTFSVTATGATPEYQWYLNGIAISGATSSSYIIPSALPANAGTYTVSLANSSGSVTSQAAQLTVLNPSRLTNLSVLSLDGPGSQLLTVGFVSGGTSTEGSQNVLIRGSGPALALNPFNVPNVLQDPTLTLYNSSTTVVDTNDNWGTPASNAHAVVVADASTGAFALTNTSSLDAALVTSLVPGGYSVQVAGKNGESGNVIAEVYDYTPTGSYIITTPRLVNLSCLQKITSGGILSAGFVIGGTTTEQVLIRTSGPTLAAAPFNLSGTVPDPKLTVYNSSSTVLATNTGWGGNAAITAACQTTGAFQFINTTSKDSAVLLTLQPGAYTVQATSASGSAGIALIEIYEVAQ